MNADMVELQSTWYDDVQACSKPMEASQTRSRVIVVVAGIGAARDPYADGALVLIAGARTLDDRTVRKRRHDE